MLQDSPAPKFLIRKLGLADLDNPVVGSTVRHAVRYTVGGHGSSLLQILFLIQLEQQQQRCKNEMGTFFAADGQSLPISA